MDARYAYASEILKFRLRQIQEFYAPALVHIEQSRVVYEKLRWTIKQERKDIPLDGFRLLDHIYQFEGDPKLNPLVDRILAIGKNLTTLISQKAGLIEGGITSTFIEYQGHFEILNAAREQESSKEEKEGWHELGYYPRILNREIIEGYKVVFAHLENCAKAGDQIMYRLLGQKTGQIGEYRRQLVENLQFYERHAKDYATKFDTFDLSGIRKRFIDQIEKTRNQRPQTVTNGRTQILDVGCGTGRDAYEFVKKGYAVTAIDPSPAMLRMCRRKLNDAFDEPENAGMKEAAHASSFFEKTFDEIGFRNQFDGVWAAASLLHVPSQQMEGVLRKLIQALKPNGILFMSFKHGCGEHEYDARYYSYYSRKQLRFFLKRIQGAYELEVWLSNAEGKNLSPKEQSQAWALEFINHYDRTRWLNVLVTRERV